MKSDIQIAQEAVLAPIGEVAEKLDIKEDELEYYGKYKAKISSDIWERVKDNDDGKLILVTAINPTPAGEERLQRVSDLEKHLIGLERKLL